MSWDFQIWLGYLEYIGVFPIGTTTVTCSISDYAGNTGTGTFTVTVISPADTTPPTMTASAYLNSTSSTGRTLNVITDNLDSSYTQFTVKKDGTVVEPFASMFYQTLYNTVANRQIEIPVNWVAGTYNLIWNTFCSPSGSEGLPSGHYGSMTWDPCFTESSSTFTVPAADTTHLTQPAMTASAYLNSTSSTGRSLQVDNGIDSGWTYTQFTVKKDGTVVEPFASPGNFIP